MGKAKTISVRGAFEGIKVVGSVDILVRFGTSQKISLGETSAPEPRFEVNDKKKLIITMANARRKREKDNRPKVVVTTPVLNAVEAFHHASVEVRKIKNGGLLIVVEENARITADGHCESLTLHADKAGRFLGKGLTADNAIVSARRKSEVTLGEAKSLIQSGDSTSRVDVAGGNVGLIQLRNR